MKKIRTFMIVFMSMFLYMTVLHILSTPKVNAKKSIHRLLSGFINDKATTVRVFYYKDAVIAQTRDILQDCDATSDLENLLYRYVTRMEHLSKDYKPPNNFVRVELNNSTEQISLDFPTGALAFQSVTVITKWSGNNSIYELSKVGARKIKSFLIKDSQD